MSSAGAGDDGMTTIEVEVLFWGKSGEERLLRQPLRVVEGTTLEDLVRLLSTEWGFDLHQAILERRAYFLAVNGSHCDLRRKRTARLKAHDSVAVLPVAAGG